MNRILGTLRSSGSTLIAVTWNYLNHGRLRRLDSFPFILALHKHRPGFCVAEPPTDLVLGGKTESLTQLFYRERMTSGLEVERPLSLGTRIELALKWLNADFIF